MAVDGNLSALFQVKAGTGKNAIGECVTVWEDYSPSVKGWLDLSAGDSKHTTFNAKVQESTHIFLCDYMALPGAAENSRLVIDGQVYEILLIDNPMNMNEHLEIYLRFIGGQ